jgi:hypothetical protein
VELLVQALLILVLFLALLVVYHFAGLLAFAGAALFMSWLVYQLTSDKNRQI